MKLTSIIQKAKLVVKRFKNCYFKLNFKDFSINFNEENIFTIISTNFIFSFTQFNVNSEELKSKNVLISLNQNNLNNNLVLSTDSSDDKNVDIFLSGIGDNPQIDKTILSRFNKYKNQIKSI